ncbi:MAG TPA: NfeD family protein [Acidobacteriota bacterium]|nr:NfeD family protein [Acidobacteriota bacterium]
MYLTLDTILIGLPIAVVVIAIAVFLTWLTIRAHHRKVETGSEGFVGEKGVCTGDGKVFVHGEIWQVDGGSDLVEGDKVIVEEVDGMILRVRKI